jgi:hypothetical protein
MTIKINFKGGLMESIEVSNPNDFAGVINLLKDTTIILDERKKQKSKRYKCANCEENKVEHKGEYCEACDLPERSAIK